VFIGADWQGGSRALPLKLEARYRSDQSLRRPKSKLRAHSERITGKANPKRDGMWNPTQSQKARLNGAPGTPLCDCAIRRAGLPD